MNSVVSKTLAVDAFLHDRESQLLSLVCDLVATNSQIPPTADERSVVALLVQVMDQFGFPRGEVLAPVPERPSLITRLSGTGNGLSLMLNGHVDTKPVGQARDLWHTNPLDPTIIDGQLFGLGTNDMKAAVAAMVYAALALRETGIELAGDLVLGFVADEENGASQGSKFVAPLLKNVDAVLVGEPSGWEYDWQGIHLVSRGVCCFRIKVTGTQRHSSLSDRMPNINASLRMADLMLRIGEELKLPFEPHALGGVVPTLNPGVMVSGGTYFGVIPGNAEFACDLRTIPGMTKESVQRAVDYWLDECRKADPDLIVDAVFDQDLGWVPWSELSSGHPLVGAVQRSAEDVLGIAPPLSVFPGGTDAPWYEAAGIRALPSFGPGMITSAHGPNEFVSVASIHQAARMYARIAMDFCGSAVGTME